MRKEFEAAFAVFCVLAALPADAQTAGASGIPQYPAVALDKYVAGQTAEATIEYDGQRRKFLYYIPGNFNPKTKHPLILILHGANQPVEVMVSVFAAVLPRADTDGTILVYPVSTGDREKNTLLWNAKVPEDPTQPPLPKGLDKVDDVGFISRVIDIFRSRLNVDNDRVYVTGVSWGGGMTYALSCYIPERFAAVAPALAQVSTDIVAKFATVRPLPIMIISGTADPVAPAVGGGFAVSAETNIAYWKSRNGISAEPVETALDDPVTEVFKGVETPSHIIRYSWKGANGNDLIWLKVVNGGHWLPTYEDGKAVDTAKLFGGGTDMSFLGNQNSDYMAPAGIYDFLLSHTRKDKR